MGMKGKKLDLVDLTPEELEDAVVMVDTAVRFSKGNENDATDMSVFSALLFDVMSKGAAGMLMLYHSMKSTKESPDLTLENAIRGSGDTGAALDTCWATRLMDPEDSYSPSYLKNVKPRAFEGGKPFTVRTDRVTGILTREDGPTPNLPTKFTGDKDGKQAAAEDFIRDHPNLPAPALVELLAATGIKRGLNWVKTRRRAILIQERGSGARLTSGEVVTKRRSTYGK